MEAAPMPAAARRSRRAPLRGTGTPPLWARTLVAFAVAASLTAAQTTVGSVFALQAALSSSATRQIVLTSHLALRGATLRLRNSVSITGACASGPAGSGVPLDSVVLSAVPSTACVIDASGGTAHASIIKGATVSLTGLIFVGANTTTTTIAGPVSYYWPYYGGAIACLGACSLTVTDVGFYRNAAVAGGAIAVDPSSSLTVERGAFSGCNATMAGGAIFAATTIKSSPGGFIGAGGGGPGSASTAPATSTDSSATAKAGGGALVTIRDARFSKNSAIGTASSSLIERVYSVSLFSGMGGAVAVDSTATLFVSGSSFDGNGAAVNGGAVAVLISQSSSGGPPSSTAQIALTGGRLHTLTNCAFSSNSAGVTFSPNATAGADLTVALGVGGAAYVAYAESLLVSSSTFTANRGPKGGGALHVGLSSAVTIRGSLLAQNNGSSFGGGSGGGYMGFSPSLLVQDTVFRENTAYNDFAFGGALVAANLAAVNEPVVAAAWAGRADGASTLRNVSFVANRADAGGASVLIGGTADVAGCVFMNNSAYYDDSASTTRSGAGGALGVVGATATVQSTVFYGNTAVQAGAMLISDNARLTVTNSELTRNTASHPTRGYGGAALNIDSLLAFVDSRINDNSGGVGGALYSGSGGVLRLTRTTVCSNVATVSGGGGIATQNDNAVVSVTDSTICQNTAQTTGGGLWFEDGTELTATGSTISSNVASKGGGGGVACSATCSVALINSSVANNRGVGDGGGLQVGGASHITVDSDSTIQLNSATQSGGGIASGAGATLVINGVVANNTAGSAGGALFSSGGGLGSIVLSGATVANNSVTGASPRGGALSVHNVPELNATDSSLSGNTVTPFVSTGGSSLQTLIINTVGAGSGGAAFIASDPGSGPTSARFTRCALSSNSAFEAGAIATYGNVSLVVASSDFRLNEATGNAGAVLVPGNSTASVVGCTFESNTAGGTGGALNVTVDSPLNITSTLFQRNRAARGGALALGGSSPSSTTLSDITFAHNAASDSGGVVFLEQSALLTALQATGAMTARGSAALLPSRRSLASTTAELAACLAGAAGCTSTNNTASNYGPTIATVPQTVAVQAPTVAVNGDPLNLNVTLADDFSQVVMEWSDLSVSVTASDATVLTGVQRTRLFNGVANFDSLVLKGDVNSTYTLFVQLTSATLDPALTSQPLNVTLSVQPCASDEYFDNVTKTCLCVPESSRINGVCRCKFTFWADESPSGEKICRPCPDGAYCPGVPLDGHFAKEGFWSPPNSTRYYPCDDGLCKLQDVGVDDHCRTGHTGLLCALCIEGYTYQGDYCAVCPERSSWTEWPLYKKALLVITFSVVALVAFTLFLWTPLLPPKLSQRVVDQAVGLVTWLNSVRRWARRHFNERRSRKARGPAVIAAAAGAGGTAVAVAGAVRPLPGDHGEEPEDDEENVEGLLALLRAFSLPLRLIVDNVQIVTSFTKSMRIPWPTIYYSITSVLSIINLNFVRLPSAACTAPNPDTITIFYEEVAALTGFLVVIAASWPVGRWILRGRGEPEEDVHAYRRKLVSRFVLTLHLAYAPISSVVLQIFSCRKVGGTWYMSIDPRQECFTPRHNQALRVAAFFVCVYPVGVPLFYFCLLQYYRIPQTAAQLQANVVMRTVAQWAVAAGVTKQRPHVDLHRITTDNIEDDHLNDLFEILCTAPLPCGDLSHFVLAERRRTLERSKSSGRLKGAGSRSGRDRAGAHSFNAGGAGAGGGADALPLRAAGLPGGFAGGGAASAASQVTSPAGRPEMRQNILWVDADAADIPGVLRDSAAPRDGGGGGAARGSKGASSSSAGPVAESSSGTADTVGGNGNAGAHPVAPGSPLAAPAALDTSLSASRGGASPAASPPSTGRDGNGLGASGFLRSSIKRGAVAPIADGSSSLDGGSRHAAGDCGPGLSRSGHGNGQGNGAGAWGRTSAVLRFTALTKRHVSLKKMQSLSRQEKVRMVVAVGQERLPIARSAWGDNENDRGEEEEKAAQQAIGMLFDDFSITCWWWELVEITKKLILTSVLGFISKGSPAQVVAGLSICYASVLLITHIRPYAGTRTDQIGIVGQNLLFWFFMAGLLLKLKVVIVGGIGNEVFFSVIVGMFTVAVVTVPFIILAYALMFDDRRGRTKL